MLRLKKLSNGFFAYSTQISLQVKSNDGVSGQWIRQALALFFAKFIYKWFIQSSIWLLVKLAICMQHCWLSLHKGRIIHVSRQSALCWPVHDSVKKYWYIGMPWYFFGVVRTTIHLSVPRYSGVTIFIKSIIENHKSQKYWNSWSLNSLRWCISVINPWSEIICHCWFLL